MIMAFIKKFVNYLIFGKISLGYKEHEILEILENKPIIDDSVNIIICCLLNIL